MLSGLEIQEALLAFAALMDEGAFADLAKLHRELDVAVAATLIEKCPSDPTKSSRERPSWSTYRV